MNRASRFLAVMLFGIIGVCAPVLAEPTVFDLDGREAVVLVQKNWKADRRGKYEKISVTIHGRTVKARIPDANESTYFSIDRHQQKDDIVRQALGNSSYGWYYGKDPDFAFPYSEFELDGRQVVVRLYKDISTSPGKFEKVAVMASQKIVTMDFEDVESPAVVAVLGGDQADPVVEGVLYNRAYCWNYEKGLTFELGEERPSKYESFRWIFADAVGNLLSGAEVEIFLATRRPQRWISIGKVRLDEEATIDLPFCAADEDAYIALGERKKRFMPGRFTFKISHSDYEAVAVIQTNREKYRPGQVLNVYAPMLLRGSELAERGIWGVVVDEQGNPVEGVVVRSVSITPPGGENVPFAVFRQVPGVLTDSGGRFLFYPRVSYEVEAIGPIIPPKSRYSVRIEPPEYMGFKAFKGSMSNGKDHVIRLERVEKKYFHRFAFEDENGLITEQKRLKDINVEIERGERASEYLRYSEWYAGGEFPLGVYKARYSSSRGGNFRFLPVEVTQESPKEIVFKTVSGEKKYYGKIVHVITGAPMEGVFVKQGGLRAQLDLPEHQWRILNALPGTDPNVKEPRRWIEDYRQLYQSGRLVRTNGEGLFEMTCSAKTHISRLFIFERGYLCVFVENDLFEKDDEGNLGLPVTRMFPSAKIVVDPWSPVTGRDSPRNFYPRWIVEPDHNKGWVRDLLAACIDDHEEGIFREYDIDSNRGPQTFHVPAGVTFGLQLRPWPHHYRDESIWSPITLGRDLKLEQGEVLDLGRIEIKRAFNLFAEVHNSMGAAVEGLLVRAHDQYGEVVSNTDDDGVAMFTVARDSRGQFVIEYEPPDGQDGPHLRQTVPYEVTGPQDANSVYSFKVSDEIVYHHLR